MTQPTTAVAPTRDAATIAVLREGTVGMEVFLMHRVTGMAFAGGMTVFPGGGVDARDTETDLTWVGPTPAWWAQCFGCPEDTAAALVCAAVRETFEECGVLLAGPTPDTVVGDTSEYGPARAALVAKELSFAQFLAGEALVLRADLVRPWSHWITPEAEPRRYDTRFFVAALPDGQIADGATTEASHAEWQRPQEAIAEWRGGVRALLPPTWVTLTELDACGDVAGVLAAERTIVPVMPSLVNDGDGFRVSFPGDEGFPTHLGHARSAQ
ncbi:MAG: NUDIX hydrolase [Actinomycetota bacterium]|nr:NUDIX hydrolase [Actinomycetota bacterium]